MPASPTLQIQLNKWHSEFMLSEHTEPLEWLRNNGIPIEWRIRKYVKVWRENKQSILRLRKQNSI